MKVTFKEFENIYVKHLENIFKFWNVEMQQKVAKHNVGWAPPFSFKNYLDKSVKRFYLAYQNIPAGTKTCCDIGGFWGVFPVVLKELGYDVTMTEAKKFYDSSFDNIFNYVEGQGVKILDIDPFYDSIEVEEKFDYISVMAVLEHIPNSLNFFLDNLKASLSEKGRLYIEVPNIASYSKRLALLKGNSPLPNIMVVNKSASPFIGHVHEYTLKELVQLSEMMSMKVENTELYNYSIKPSIKRFLTLPIETIAHSLFPNTRECIAVLSRVN